MTNLPNISIPAGWSFGIKLAAHWAFCWLVLWGAGCGSPPESANRESGTSAAKNLSCSYLPVATVSNPDPGMSFFENCIRVSPDGTFDLIEPHLAQIDFGDDDLAILHADSGWAWVSRSGKTAWAYTFDNGADYFVEGLARTVRGSKVGFVDRDLNVVIEPVWDFATPFEDGLAAVCTGCRSVPACEGCEHSKMVGGQWGYIDTTGAVVLPVSLAQDQLPTREAVRARNPPG